MNIVVAGIHTGIGKTICSAVLAEALQCDYWKPVQAGNLEESDSVFVANNIANTTTVIHKEAYQLTKAASPHWAAKEDGVEINLETLRLPNTTNTLVIESAGGIMSPLSNTLLNIDMMKYFGLPVVVVSNNYLGSINHTLLTVQALRNAKVPIIGLVFSGEEVGETRRFIIDYTGVPLLFSIPQLKSINKEAILKVAAKVSQELKASLNGYTG